QRIEYLVLYTALTVGINTLCSCLKNIFDITKEKYADTFERYISMQIAEKCIDMDFQHTEDKKVLEQLEKAKTGMDWYSDGIAGILNAFSNIVTNLITALGVVIILVTGMPWLILVYMVSMVIDMLLTKKTNEVNLRSFKNLAKTNQIFSYVFWELQDIRFGKDIRLYGAEPMMEEKGKYYNDQMTLEWRKQAMDCLPYDEGSTVLGCVRWGSAILMIGAKAVKGLISLGDFTMYFNAGNTLYDSIKGIAWQMQNLYQKLCYANEFIVFMEYPNAVRHGELLPQKVKEHTIEFKNVSFTYPGSQILVLKNINIVLHPGEHISIVGLNGAGKTTFIKLLCRLYDPTEGEILLDGVDIREIVYEEYVKLLAVVFQDFQLFAFTARENVTLAESFAKAEDMRKNEEKIETDYKGKKANSWGSENTNNLAGEKENYGNSADSRFAKVIEQAGLTGAIADLKYGADTYIMKSFDNEGCEMSGGQQQKMAIARALYKDSPVVILDEPTAALDPIAEYEIYRQFHTLVGGKTAIYISHRLSSCQFCDVIYVFVDGEIAERGTHTELVELSGGHYAKMFEAQAQYYR
ncbi:MAG: ABC transporter ATP-binding protein/permease, partial [Lachnospiraceae bacterium]|nr:ABC transporter ATP-binding protein/permease [Lachnospiraceae bacterium]